MNETELPEGVWGMPPPVDISMFPIVAEGRLKGEFTVTAHNPGAQPVEAYVCARGSGLRCELGATPLHVPQGASRWVDMAVRSVDRNWFGKPIEHPFEVSCLTPEGLNVSSTRAGSFVQKPLLPWWLLVTIAALGLLLGLLLAYALPDRTTVPSVSGARSAIEAEAILREAGLELGTQFGQPPSELPAGTVLGQQPSAGTEVDEGSRVSIVVAAPTTVVTQAPASSSPSGFSAEQTALIAGLPPEFRERCASVAGAPSSSAASVYCIDTDGIEIFVYQFTSVPDLQGAYDALVNTSGAIRDAGVCGEEIGAEGEYRGPDGAVLGRVLCIVDRDGIPLDVWTADAELIQYQARWSRGASELAAWWNEVGRTLPLRLDSAGSLGGTSQETLPPAEGQPSEELAEPETNSPTSPAPSQPSEPGVSPPAASGEADSPAEPVSPVSRAVDESDGPEPSGPMGETALAFLEGVFNDRDPSVIDLLGDPYYEHNPSVGDGAGGVLALISELAGVEGDLVETHRIVESDDLVAIHSSYALDTAFEPDRGDGSVVGDIFRFNSDGRIIEHWSVSQALVPTENTASGRSMVDGGGDPAAAVDPGTNVTLVRRLYDEVLVNADIPLLEDLFAEDFVDHNPEAFEGVDRWQSLLQAGPIPVEVARVVAQGDLVFVHVHYLEGALGDVAVVDIFRIENGLIVEQWSVVQPTIPAEETASGNDMFARSS